MSSILKSTATEENKASTQNGVKRLIFVGIAMLLEIILDVGLMFWLNQYEEWIMILLHIIAAVLVLVIYNQNKTSAMKVPWIILIMALPVLGLTLYLLIGLNPGMYSMRKRYKQIDAEVLPLLEDSIKEGLTAGSESVNLLKDDLEEAVPEDASDADIVLPEKAPHMNPIENPAVKHLDEIDPGAANIAKYLHGRAHYPAYENIKIEYFNDAAKGIAAQKEELKKAEKFIFMEYHAIENAESWQAIQEILEDRVKAGVEVRVFYDDMGSIGFIDTDFVKLLESKGIRCRVFNPFRIGLNLFMNNRDHRKITVIDGRVGFTGGYNIANEYFNITHPFGHWKDTGIKIYGEAVKSLTVTFLEMWNAISGDDDNDTDYRKYLPDISGYDRNLPAGSPLDDEHVGEDVYISVAEYAKKYAWYVTPYLILTDEMIHALGLAAKRGVDVRVITPGIPDKPIVYSITRSYYYSLIRNGVRIFEYSPGFCHCKMSVADDNIATCGTINLDYRSLYHHFENGCLYAHCKAVADTKADFESIMSVSREVTDDYKSPSDGRKVGQMLLRLIAPLM